LKSKVYEKKTKTQETAIFILFSHLLFAKSKDFLANIANYRKAT